MKFYNETEKEKEAKARLTRKNNSPSPTSYKVAEAMEKTSGKGSMDRSGRFYKMAKSKRNSYIE